MLGRRPPLLGHRSAVPGRKLRHRHGGIPGHGLEGAGQFRPQPLRGLLGHARRIVLHNHAELVPWRHHHVERVVGPARAADTGDARQCLLPGVVGRGVLVDDERVEELAQPHGALDLGERRRLVRGHPRLLALQPGEGLEQGLVAAQREPGGQRVGEETRGVLDAGQVRGAPGHGDAEDDVVVARHGGERHGPRALQHGVGGEPVRPRHLDEALRGPRSEGQVLSGLLRPPTGGLRRLGAEHRGVLESGQAGAPRLQGGVGPGADPGDVRAERQGRGQLVPLAAVQGHEVAHHQGRGPAVRDQVVRAEDQHAALRAQPHQRGGHERCPGHVHRAVGHLGQQRRHGALGGGVRGRAQVHGAPRNGHRARDRLHGLAHGGRVERRAQHRVAPQHGVKGILQPLRVHGPLDLQRGREDVGVRLSVGERVEEQALLQRGQRQHVRHGAVLAFEGVDVRLWEAVGQVRGTRSPGVLVQKQVQVHRGGSLAQGLTQGVEVRGGEHAARGAQLDPQPRLRARVLEDVDGQRLGQAPLGGLDDGEGAVTVRGPAIRVLLGRGDHVEHDLRLGQIRETLPAQRVEVAQDAVPGGVRARAARLLGRAQQRGEC